MFVSPGKIPKWILLFLASIFTFNLQVCGQEVIEKYVFSGFTVRGENPRIQVVRSITDINGSKDSPKYEAVSISPPVSLAKKILELEKEVQFYAGLGRYYKRDLELIDSQSKALKQTDHDFKAGMGKLGYDFGKGKITEAEFEKGIARLQKKISSSVEKLLPHQVERFVYLRAKMEVDRLGLSVALFKGDLGEKLDVTEEQKKELFELNAELRDDLAEILERFHKKSRKKIYEKLAVEQKKGFKEIFESEDLELPVDHFKKFIRQFMPYFRF